MDNNLDEFPQTGFVRAKQCHRYFCIGLSTWWLWVREGKAPPGIRLGSRTTVWRAEDIRELGLKLAEKNAECDCSGDNEYQGGSHGKA